MNITFFDPNNIEIDEKSYKSILTCYIGYAMNILDIKKGLNIYSVNPLYLNFVKVNECLEEINGNKYLTQVPTNESKK